MTSEVALGTSSSRDGIGRCAKSQALLIGRIYADRGNRMGPPYPQARHQVSVLTVSISARQNLNVRMHTRRFTRLTNAFSKKIENHAHSVALFAMYYNFVRIHKTLRVTPAMAAGVTDRLWEIGDIVQVLEDWENTN